MLNRYPSWQSTINSNVVSNIDDIKDSNNVNANYVAIYVARNLAINNVNAVYNINIIIMRQSICQ